MPRGHLISMSDGHIAVWMTEAKSKEAQMEADASPNAQALRRDSLHSAPLMQSEKEARERIAAEALENGNASQDEQPKSGAESADKRGQALRVLVVEDDADLCAILSEAIVDLGYLCATARDGLQAWTLHQREDFDVILSDWNMPQLTGLELCRRTRTLDGKTYTYFILMTGMSEKKHFLTGMDAGADDYITKPVDLEELEVRLKSAARVTSLHRELANNNVRLRRDSEHFFSVARTDALTQAGNRLRLEEDLRAFEARGARYGHRHCVALIDIDHFKNYNDAFGHPAGDEVLRQVADCMRESLRSGDQLYRYGGEEFLVILPEQSLEEGALAMERLRTSVQSVAIAQAPEIGGCITVSVGVASGARLGEASTNACIKRADVALYQAKKAGRNRVETDASEVVADDPVAK